MKCPLLVRGLALLLCVSAAPAMSEEDTDRRIAKFERGLRPAVHIVREPEEHWRIEERMAHHKVPGVSIAVLKDGKIAWAKGYGRKDVNSNDEVDDETMFSIGSLSKVISAVATLRLADMGSLDIDRNVNGFLTSWKVPENEYTAIRPATLRGILSHTAGFSVHGFPDFKAGDQLPTVIETLDGAAPALTEAVRVVQEPGSEVMYSGGGVTVEQLVIEDVTGLDFPAAIDELIFTPLALKNSSFMNPLPAEYANVAKPHGNDGERTDWEVMPEMAASGLWTTPSDYATILIELLRSYKDGKDHLLRAHTVMDMMTEVSPSEFGLGPILSGRHDGRYIWHGGANNSYKTWMEAHLATGDGVVIFTNGSAGDDLRGEILRAVAAAEGWKLSQSREVVRCAHCADFLQDYVGIYEVISSDNTVTGRGKDLEVAHEITLVDGSLYISRLGRHRAERLIAEDLTHFVMERNGTLIKFDRGYDRSVAAMQIFTDISHQKARRVPADESL